MRNIKLVLLAGLLATGLSAGSAQAMPISNLATVDAGAQAETVRWVCGPRRCWWRPNVVRVRPLAVFDNDRSLRSGWALGQERLKDTAAVVEATVGNGKLVLYGPNILFRAQSHGTFKLLFNAIYAGHATAVGLK